MNRPNLFSVLPAAVRYDKSLKANAKLLYSEITALTNQEGFCWADNAYFASLYEVDEKTVSRWISQLRDRGYIGVKILHAEGNKREITIDRIVTTYTQKSHYLYAKKSRGSDEKVTPIYENNTINNTKNKREGKALAFLENNFPSDYEAFMLQQGKEIKDFKKFAADFSDQVEIEGLEWERRKLFARLRKYARNWIENQVKFSQGVNVQLAPAGGITQRIELKRRGHAN